MTWKRIFLPCVALACLFCVSPYAQEPTPRNRLAAAHAQYYTPTTGGLKSFRCDATIDWKGLFSRISGSDMADDNPWLVYLNSVQLSVSDDLHGAGSLTWTDTTAPPQGKEAALKQMHDGFQEAIAGFFQAWNAYMNGSMVPLPDSSLSITTSGEGFHVSAKTNDMHVDEDFDRNMLLKQVLVVSPEIRVLALPEYVNTPDGLLVSSVKSKINQPPTAPETESTFQMEYAKVSSFQIPSHVVLDIKNTGVIEYRFKNCSLGLADWIKKDSK